MTGTAAFRVQIRLFSRTIAVNFLADSIIDHDHNYSANPGPGSVRGGSGELRNSEQRDYGND